MQQRITFASLEGLTVKATKNRGGAEKSFARCDSGRILRVACG
jgi:hypothetical protein